MPVDHHFPRLLARLFDGNSNLFKSRTRPRWRLVASSYERGHTWLQWEWILARCGSNARERRRWYREYCEAAVRGGLKNPAPETVLQQMVLGGREFLQALLAGVGTIRTPPEFPQHRDAFPGHFSRGRGLRPQPGGCSRPFAEAQPPNPHWIQMNVTGQIHRPFIRINQHRFEAPLEPIHIGTSPLHL